MTDQQQQPQPQPPSLPPQWSDEIQVTDYDTVDMSRVPIEVKLAALGVTVERHPGDTDEMLHARALQARCAHIAELAELEDQCAPVVRLFGITERGDAHVLYMHEVWPYLYLQAPPEMEEADTETFAQFLHFALPDIYVHSVELLRDRYDYMYYHDAPQPVLRITLHRPEQVSKLRDFWFGHDPTLPPIAWCGMQLVRRVFEANVVFYRRVCVDKDIVPFSWVRVPAAVLRCCGVRLNGCFTHTLLPQQQVEALGCAGPRALICPKLRVASYDIECKGYKSEFPNPQRDPIISISVVLYEGVNCARVIDAVVFISVCHHRVDDDGDGSASPLLLSSSSSLGRGVIAPPVDEHNPDADRFRVVECADERALLLAWSEYLRCESQMSFLVGYNIDRFDTDYVRERAQVHNCWSTVGRLSPWNTHDMLQMRKSMQNTRAHGRSDDYNVRLAGVLDVDAFRIVKKETRLRDGTRPRSYKLGDICAAFLQERDSRVVTKRDLPYTEIGPHWSGTPQQRWTLCDYNEWDSRLVGMLCGELCLLTNLIAMARVTNVDVSELVCGGQQIKVYMQMLALARRLRFVIPTRWSAPRANRRNDEDGAVDEDVPDPNNPEDNNKDKDDKQLQSTSVIASSGKKQQAPNNKPLVQGLLGPFIAPAAKPKKAQTAEKKKKEERKAQYDGAVVIEPARGFYETPITTLDFSSLYPSIMRTHNLSHDTLVGVPVRCVHGHCMLKSAEALRCCVHATPLGARFVNESVRRGLLSQLLSNLLTERGAAKRAMAAAKDESERNVLDGRQNALKISANSVYGATGATVGNISCIEISAGVTAYGRDMIMDIKAITERVYSLTSGYHAHSKVVYGDSVTGDTPVLVSKSNSTRVILTTMEKLDAVMCGKYVVAWHGNKECFDSEDSGWQVWNGCCWTPIIRVIRHKAPGKRLVRVITNAGCVDVTEDHSLLSIHEEKVRPRDIAVGTELLHDSLPEFPHYKDESELEKEAFMLGIAVAQGKVDVDCTELINAGVNVQEAFLNGYCQASGGFKDMHGNFYIMSTAHTKKMHMAILYILATSQDMLPWLTHLGNGLVCMFILARTDEQTNVTLRKLKAGRNRVVALHDLPPCDADQYVYDLETASHTFSAGIGELVVHNTDSIMVDFQVKTVDEARQAGVAAAALINACFDLRAMTDDQRSTVASEVSAALHTTIEPAALQQALERNASVVAPLISSKHRGIITIVFEKVLYPYLLINKKRYVGGFWLRGDRMDHIHMSGIESVRRDNSYFTNKLIKKVIKLIIKRGSLQLAIEYARERVLALARGRVPFSELIVTKGYTKAVTDYADGPQHDATPGDQYKDGERYTGTQPHLIVVRKRLERHMQPYKMGERVPYVLVYHQGQDAMRSSSRSGGKRRTQSTKKQKQCDIVEDPEYAQAHALMPNTEYYLKHQAEKPLMRIFDTALGQYATQRLILTADVTSVATAPVRANEQFFGAFKAAAAASSSSSSSDAAATTLTSVAEYDNSAAKRQRTAAVATTNGVAEEADIAPFSTLVPAAVVSSSSSMPDSVLFMSTSEKLEWWRNKRSHQDAKLDQFISVTKRTTDPDSPAVAAVAAKGKQSKAKSIRKSTWI